MYKQIIEAQLVLEVEAGEAVGDGEEAQSWMQTERCRRPF